MAGAAVQYCGAQNYTVYAGAVPGATEYVFVTNGSHAVGFVTEDFRPCESMPLKVTNVTPTSLVMMADGFDSSCNARVSANNIKIADFGEYGVLQKGPLPNTVSLQTASLCFLETRREWRMPTAIPLEWECSTVTGR